MLANLSISSWTASKKDKAASKAVKDLAGATAKSGWFNKCLIDRTALEPLSKIEGRARDTHYRMTLAWGDNGDRLLPAMAYMDYVDAMRAFKTDYENEVVKFVAQYPQLVQGGRALLGSMYDPADYPEAWQIKDRFSIRTSFSPVADAEDFRVQVGDEAVAEIRKSINESVEARLHAATQECWARLDEVVSKMAVTLDDPKATFRDSLVENIRVLVELLPKLNVANDTNLGLVLRSVRLHLLVDPQSLRKDKHFRRFTCDKAEEILKDIKPWLTP